MTDGRYPDRWLSDRRFAQISAEAHRLFVVANTWSASNRTDGAITRDDLNLFPRYVDVNRTHELVATELWIDVDGGWQIRGFDRVQTTAAQLDAAEHARALDRERKARDRAKAAAVSAGPKPVRPDIPPDVLVDSTGQRQSQATIGEVLGPESSNSKPKTNFGRGAAQDQRFDWASVGAKEPEWVDGDPDYPSWAEEYERHRTWRVPA